VTELARGTGFPAETESRDHSFSRIVEREPGPEPFQPDTRGVHSRPQQLLKPLSLKVSLKVTLCHTVARCAI
jgi:hypothetical protein